MSLISSLFTGVSGLLGNSKAMNIIGDNIANVNTVGFKGSKAVFGDLFSTVLNNGPTTSQLGRGSMLQGIIQSFDQGAFETSSNALDLAIDGNGFFVVNDGIGNFYTRAGQFRMNDDGVVQTLSGEILQGFEITQGVRGSVLKDIDLAGVQSAPQATTTFTLGANLNAAASAGTTFVSPVSIFNSVGSQVILSVAYTKLASTNSWNYTLTPSQGTVTSTVSGTISFDTCRAVAVNQWSIGRSDHRIGLFQRQSPGRQSNFNMAGRGRHMAHLTKK